MSAVLRKGIADVRRRRLQTTVIAIVALLSATAATMATSLLLESNAPYDHAFQQVNGPHLVVTFDAARVSAGQAAATAAASGITQASGPFPSTVAQAQFSSAGPKGAAPISFGIQLIGRPSASQTVDRLIMDQGRWPTSEAEIVISSNLAHQTQTTVGDQITFPGAPRQPSLTVVGTASSIVAGDAAWVLPAELPALSAPQKDGPPEGRLVMEYRVAQPDQPATLGRELAAISASLPRGAILASSWWLYARKGADLTAAVMVPFLVAFSALGLLAAGFVISNVVAGVAVADRRQIGIMKSIGFTPTQCVGALLPQVLIPTLGGAAVGVVLGGFAAQPFLADTAAALGLPTYLGATGSIASTVVALVLMIALVAAAHPAIRAGRMSAVAAIAIGSGPSNDRGAGAIRALGRLRLGPSQRLGVADLAARPVRATTTAAAILLGTATVTFALALTLSLHMVASSLGRNQAVQVEVSFAPDEPASTVAAVIASQPGTLRATGEGEGRALVTGLASPIPFYGYDGGSDWTGYAMVSGRWFSSPGEVVAPSHLIDVTGLHLGQTFTASSGGGTERLTLVGEVFDQTGDDLLLRGRWQDVVGLNPDARIDSYEIAIDNGVDPRLYASRLDSVSPLIDARPSASLNASTAFVLIETVVGALALVLVLIAAAGVLNTVVLRTRERRHEIAILKAVGMDPGQVVGMILSGVVIMGLLGGGAGVPLGLAMHHQILASMAEIATNTRVPQGFYAVLGYGALAGLALVGVVVAVVGAWLPAGWSARERPAGALQAE